MTVMVPNQRMATYTREPKTNDFFLILMALVECIYIYIQSDDEQCLAYNLYLNNLVIDGMELIFGRFYIFEVVLFAIGHFQYMKDRCISTRNPDIYLQGPWVY